jgi:hypothetical protein
MLFPTTSRDWDGVCLVGQLVGLRLQPDADGKISVMVIGLPEITGLNQDCRLSSCDELPSFAPAEIHVHDTRLECFGANPLAPVLRTGFTLELEPGMAPLLRIWLARLVVVATASKTIADKFSAQLPPPIYHMFGAITSVVARIVLDGWEAEHSVAYEREHGIWSREREFMAQFDAEDVGRNLRALATAPVREDQQRNHQEHP